MISVERHSLKWTRYGPHALLLRFAEQAGERAFNVGQALVRQLQSTPPPGLVEVTPAFVSVLLEFDPAVVPDPAQLAAGLVASLERATIDSGAAPKPVEIPVVYDGPDLGRVAAHTKLSAAEVAARHIAPLYRVHLLGFAPGFAYLQGLDPRLHTPRRDTPRARVPAGSVAIGGEHTGVYPLPTAGGWNLIGRSPLVFFVAERAAQAGTAPEAFLLKPGDAVRFVPWNR